MKMILQRALLLAITPFGLVVLIMGDSPLEWWRDWRKMWRDCPTRW